MNNIGEEPKENLDSSRLDWLQSKRYACLGVDFDVTNAKWCFRLECSGYAELGLSLRDCIDRAMTKDGVAK